MTTQKNGQPVKKEEIFEPGKYVMATFAKQETEPWRVISCDGAGKLNQDVRQQLESSRGTILDKVWKERDAKDALKKATPDQEQLWIQGRQDALSNSEGLTVAARFRLRKHSDGCTVDTLLDYLCVGLSELEAGQKEVYRAMLIEIARSRTDFAFDDASELISLPAGNTPSAETPSHDTVEREATAVQPEPSAVQAAATASGDNPSSESTEVHREELEEASAPQEAEVEDIKDATWQEGYEKAKSEYERAAANNRKEGYAEGHRVATAEHAAELKKRKDEAEELIKSWRGKRAPNTDKGLAERFNAVITPLPADPATARIVSNFLQTSGNDPKSEHPLFYMINVAKSQEQKQHLISLLDLDTLKEFMGWLDRSPKDASGIYLTLIDGLSGLLSRLYYASKKPNEYQRLCEMMAGLIQKLPQEDQEPYYWRLFSFVRESWSRLAPKANVGDNDVEAVTGFLTWLPHFAEFMPEALRTTLLVSLMLDETFVKVYADIRTKVLELCVSHVLTVKPSERRLRLNSLLNLLPEAAEQEFLSRYSYDLKLRGNNDE